MKKTDKIKGRWLSSNPNAIDLLMKNPDKINWYYLSEKPSIFELNTTAIKQILLNI